MVNITGRHAIKASHRRTTNRARAIVEIKEPIEEIKCHVA